MIKGQSFQDQMKRKREKEKKRKRGQFIGYGLNEKWVEVLSKSIVL